MRFASRPFGQACRIGLLASLISNLPAIGQIHPTGLNPAFPTSAQDPKGPNRPTQPPPKPQGILVKFKATSGLRGAAAFRSPDLQGFMARHELKRCDALLKPGLLDPLKTDPATPGFKRGESGRDAAALRDIFVVQPQGSLQESLEKLKADPALEYAEIDAVVSTCQASVSLNDPFLNSQNVVGQGHPDLWGHHFINAPKAWSQSTGKNIIVAVVDSGIDIEHPDLKANLWVNAKEIPGNGLDDDGNGFIDDIHGYDFIGAREASPTPGPLKQDVSGHGTHVAGTIAATGNNGLGLAGVAFDARIMGVKVLDDSGYGTMSTCIQGLLYAASKGAQVVNCSWGSETYSKALHEAIQSLYEAGVVVIAAAGNESSDVMDFCPAHFPEVITVAALDLPIEPYSQETQGLASYSNIGARVDIAAPGSQILSLHASNAPQSDIIADHYALLSGTSMAAPHVSGVVALVMSQKPQARVEQIRQILKGSARPVNTHPIGQSLGIGCVDAAAALAISATPEAHLQSSNASTPLISQTHPLEIMGSAQGQGFASYELEWGLGRRPDSWQRISQSVQPVSKASLGSVDLKTLPEALLTLRLTVHDQNGRVFRDHSVFEPDFLAITNPAPPRYALLARQFKPGQPIPIEGRADLGNFELEWARGIEPQGDWTPISSGSGPLTGRLGEWKTQGLMSGYYTLRLRSEAHGLTRSATTLVYLETDLAGPFWPHAILAPARESGWVRRRDAQGNLEMVLVTAGALGEKPTSSYLRVRPNGSLISQTPLMIGSMKNPACGEWSDAPGQEMVFTDSLYKLSVYNGGKEIQTFDLKEYRSISSPVV